MPGREGIAAEVVATAPAMPRLASVCTSLNCMIVAASDAYIPLERFVSLLSELGLPKLTVLAELATDPEPKATELCANAWD